MLRDIDLTLSPSATNSPPRLACAVRRRPEPISHNTVRQLLLWYGLDRAATQLLREDGLIEFASPILES
jgi:hypothetical protein